MYSANKFPELTDYAPKSWVVKKVKYVFTERKEMNNPVKTTDLISLTYDRGVIPHAEKGNIGNKQKDDFAKYQLVYPDDLVINSMNVIIGSAGLSKYFGLVSPVYYILTPRKESGVPSFFHYLFRSVVFQKSLVGLGNGILEHRMRITMDTLGDQHIPLPPTATQKLIVQYLDKRTGQVNALIAKVETKIELLKEQRTSLINECVTKGLDSTVEMKDSGVKWVGAIPSHWETNKLGYLGTFYGGLSGKSGGDFHQANHPGNKPYIPYTNIYRNTYISENHFDFVVIANGENQNKVEKFDLLFLMSSETHEDLGKCCILTEEADELYLNSFCRGLRITNASAFPLFINYQLLGRVFKELISIEGRGFTRINLRQGALKNTPVFLPPVNEQKQIVAHLDKRTKQIDALIAAETRRITLLNEYKESLVSSAVTGKIRVTEKML